MASREYAGLWEIMVTEQPHLNLCSLFYCVSNKDGLRVYWEGEK